MNGVECPGTGEPADCRRPVGRRPNFYRDALDAEGQALLDAAAATPGLDDEVALLRVLLYRALVERPANPRPLLQSLNLLVRAVLARGRLPAHADEAERLERLVRSLEEALVSDEGVPNGGAPPFSDPHTAGKRSGGDGG